MKLNFREFVYMPVPDMVAFIKDAVIEEYPHKHVTVTTKYANEDFAGVEIVLTNRNED